MDARRCGLVASPGGGASARLCGWTTAPYRSTDGLGAKTAQLMRQRLGLRVTNAAKRLKYARVTSDAVSLDPRRNARMNRAKNSMPIVTTSSTNASTREKCLNAYRSLL